MAKKGGFTGRCMCGNVEFTAVGRPILCVICYCDDCQAGAQQIEALPNAQPVQNPDGGTSYVLYRKDRVEFVKGDHLLQNYKLKEKSITNRVVATCCNSAMMLSFDRGPHWVTIYRPRLQGKILPAEMRVQTQFKREDVHLPSDLPSYPAFPFWPVFKLATSRIAMYFS